MSKTMCAKQTSRSSTCSLRRLPGNATTHGQLYEMKLAALLALRARSQGLTFRLYSNVATARPWDDLILRVEAPEPITYFVQLKHGTRGGSLEMRAFVDAKDNDYHLWKYFEWFRRYREKHLRRKSFSNQDERLLCSWALEDARFIMYTNREVEQTSASDAKSQRDFPYEDMLNTGNAANVFSFRKGDEVWEMCDKDLFQKEFLPRLRIFGSQAHVDKLEALMRTEMNSLYEQPLKNAKKYVKQYIEKFKHWAEDSSEGTCITESSGQLEEVMAEDLRDRARSAAEDGAFVFKEGHCVALRDALKDRTGTLRVSVSGVPRGHRVAKLQQILDADFPDKWAYVDDKILKEFPLEALKDVCAICEVLVLDVEKNTKPLRSFFSAVTEKAKRVVLLSNSNSDKKSLQNLGASFEITEHWAHIQLTNEAQELMLDRSLDFLGTRLQLRDLQASWPSMCTDVDGALLSQLVTGDAVMGRPPPEDDDVLHHVARTVTHASVLSRDVLHLSAPSEHLVLGGFPREEIERLQHEIARKDQRGAFRKGSAQETFQKSCTVLDEGEDTSESSMIAACMRASANHPHSNIHAIENMNGVLLWRGTRGRSDAVSKFVQPISESCSSTYQALCRHEQAAEDTSAWSGRTYLLLGKPGIGKSSYLQQLAAQARTRAPRQWTVVVELLAHGSLLDAMPASKDLKVDNAVELVVAATTQSDAARRSVEAALLHSGAIHVFVDGVDEVVPAYKDKVLRLLELLLKETKAAQIWVASRPEVDASLSRLLKVVPLSVLPLSRTQQLSYLTDKWTFQNATHAPHAVENMAWEMVDAFACIPNRSQQTKDIMNPFESLPNEYLKDIYNTFNKEGSKCAMLTPQGLSLLGKTQNSGKKDLKLPNEMFTPLGRRKKNELVDTLDGGASQESLLGVPLHLKMASEVFAEDVKAALSSNRKLLKGRIHLLDLFRMFMEMKRLHFRKLYGKEHFAAKITSDSDAQEQEFHRLHTNYAMLLWTSTFPQQFRRQFQKVANKYKQYLPREKTGILWQSEDGQLKFSHYILLEYFVATWLLENIQERNRIKDCLLTAFKSKSSGSMVSFFLDLMLAEGLDLHTAVLEDDTEILQTILNAGKPIDSLDRGGRTVLHLAASYGRHEALEKLLAKKFDLERRDSLFQRTPLQYADESLEMKSAEMLLRKGACSTQLLRIPEVAADNPKLVAMANHWNLVEVQRIIMKYSPSENTRQQRNDSKTTFRKKEESMKEFNTKKPIFNKRETVITSVIEENSPNKSERFDFEVVNATIGWSSKLEYLAEHLEPPSGNEKIHSLLPHGKSKTISREFLPIHIAVIIGQLKMVQMLVTAGANVDSRGPKKPHSAALCFSRREWTNGPIPTRPRSRR